VSKTLRTEKTEGTEDTEDLGFWGRLRAAIFQKPSGVSVSSVPSVASVSRVFDKFT
jgi:hypothetical protein